MKTKHHHLKKRGRQWYLRYDIPHDVREITGRETRTKEEALRTDELAIAVRRRDRRLAEVRTQWDALRAVARRSKSGPVDVPEGPFADAIRARREGWSEEYVEDLHEQVDRKAARLAPGIDANDLDEGREAVGATPWGQLTVKQIAVARGEAHPLRPLADEWLATQHKPSKTMTDYRKALDRLCERFETVEAACEPGAPRRFVADLLKKLAKPTVNKYGIAYRGLWRLNGMDPAVWSATGLDSAVRTKRRVRWTDEEYHRLLAECDRRGDRRLRLGIRIAAHTGAAASGVAGLEVRRDDAGRLSLWLPETKKGHRPRLIPCHPEIEGDVVEWSKSPFTAKYLSKRFGEMKTAMGFDETKVLHSLRHAISYKLENAQVGTRQIKRLLGHKLSEDITFGTYNAEGLGYETLSNIVVQIEWREPQGPRVDPAAPPAEGHESPAGEAFKAS